MDENIIIGIEIDRSKGLAQVAQFTAEAEKGKGITLPVKIANQGWGKALEKESKTAGAGLTELANRSKTADSALLNMNRVVQDMPYGFMGVQNNLNPLLESFQRLKAESGSTGSAMKALVGSLAGGGGLGLALAAVGSAISFASIGLSMWAKRGQEAKASSEGLSGAINSFADSEKNANKSVADHIAKLLSLEALLVSSAVSQERKNAAIKSAKDQYPSYLGLLDMDMVKNGQLSSIIHNRLIPALIAAARARALNDKMAGVQAAALDDELSRDAKIADMRREQATLNRLNANTLAAQARGDQQAVTFWQQQAGIVKSRYDGVRESAIKFQKSIFSANTEMDKLLAKATASAPASGMIDAEGKDVMAGGAAGGGAAKSARSKIAGVKDETADLIKKLDEAAAHRFWDLMGQRASGGGLYESLKQWRDVLPKDTDHGKLQKEIFTMPELKAGLPEGIKTYITSVQQGIDKAKKDTQQKMDEFNSIIKNSMVDGLAGIGTGIGNALAGVEGLGGIFSRVGMVIGDAMIAFGRQIIASSAVVKAAMTAIQSLATMPGVGIVAGIALVAAGTAMKAALQKKANKKIGGFADGGAAYGPMLAWVGESHRTSRSNPELFARFDQFKKLVGGEIAAAFNNKRYDFAPAQNTAVLAGDVRFQIEGDRLVGVLTRAQGRQNRSY